MSNVRRIYEKYGRSVVKPLITIVVSLIIGAILIVSAGESPLDAYGVLFNGAIGSTTGWLGTLSKATPLIFTGLAAAFSMKSGIFNIGIEGQIIFGAMGAGLVGWQFASFPSFILIPMCILAAMLFAAAWAIIPGLLSNKLGINIFILFFMTNNMALLIAQYLAEGPLAGEIAGIGGFGKMGDGSRFFKFSNYSDLNAGILIAIVLIIVFAFLMYKTKFGYENSAMGLNGTFSDYIGVRVDKKMMSVLLISAMIAGLGGAEQTMGVAGRFYYGFSNEYGFTGISIALLASNNPIGVLIFSIFFGALSYGGQQMQVNTNISSNLIGVLQAVMIMMISADFMIKGIKKRKLAKAKEATE